MFQEVCMTYWLRLRFTALFDIPKSGCHTENVSCLFLSHIYCKICYSAFVGQKNEFIHFLISSCRLPKQTVKVKGWQFSIVYCYMGLCQFEYVMKRNTIVHNLKQEPGRKYNPRVSFQCSQISFRVSVFWHWRDTNLSSFGTMKHSIIDYDRCRP